MGLLDMLLGRHATPNQIPMGSPLQAPTAMPMPQQAPPPPPAGSMVQQMAQTAPAAPSNQAPMGPPITVTGTPAAAPPPDTDTWKPHKAGLLGQIADYFLDTHFGKENERRNREGALEHIMANPSEAVKRMAKFDPDGAEELYKSVIREQHQQAMEKHQTDVYTNVAENQSMGIVRNMAMNANPKNLASVRGAMIDYMTAKGIDPSLIATVPGDDATIDDFKTFALGGVPGSRQMSTAEQARGHTLTDQNHKADRAERAAYHGVLAQQGAERVAIGRTNSRTAQANSRIAQQNANTAAQRAAVYAKANGGLEVQVAPDGSAMVPDKGGMTSTRFMKDGRMAKYIRGSDGHHWRFSHQMISRDEKAMGVISAPEVDDGSSNPAD